MIRQLEQRRDQIFPVLTAAEIQRVQRFGKVQRHAHGAVLYEAGKPAAGIYVVLAGLIAISRHDGFGHQRPLAEQGPGEFTGEVGQLSGRVSLVDAHAEGEVEALAIESGDLRALLMAEADLGERIMRALILRRVELIESGGSGPILIGPENAPGMVRLQGFLTRNGQPHQTLDPAVDPDAHAWLERLAPDNSHWPLVVLADGSWLTSPSEADLATRMGMVAAPPADRIYDVAVVGAGPSGLATAVYAASEGLDVAVLDTRAYGGQAGASARIENYLGFPTGISGLALTSRAYVQAQKFGADIYIPNEAARLDCTGADQGEPLRVLLKDQEQPLQARTVVIASGAKYRRPSIPELETYEGRGVWYWASPIEAKMCRASDVVLVGGGNSAGQAAVFLSGSAARVWMLVRGPGLAESMSRYLIDRIEASPNITLLTETSISALEGDEGGLRAVRWRSGDGTETTRPTQNLFLFVGADPATGWLGDCGVDLDRGGFVLTGGDGDDGKPRPELQTTVSGVFAVGDVRAGSVKRVGGAIGEGAAVVAQIHGFLGG
jgi:thioredoxin reductase (NADPH)